MAAQRKVRLFLGTSEALAKESARNLNLRGTNCSTSNATVPRSAPVQGVSTYVHYVSTIVPSIRVKDPYAGRCFSCMSTNVQYCPQLSTCCPHTVHIIKDPYPLRCHWTIVDILWHMWTEHWTVVDGSGQPCGHCLCGQYVDTIVHMWTNVDIL